MATGDLRRRDAGLRPDRQALCRARGQRRPLAGDSRAWSQPTGRCSARRTRSHVQGIVDYIVDQAEKDEPWAFNSIVLYSTSQLVFEGVVDRHPARPVRPAPSEAFSVGEGLHRCLAWAVASTWRK